MRFGGDSPRTWFWGWCGQLQNSALLLQWQFSYIQGSITTILSVFYNKNIVFMLKRKKNRTLFITFRRGQLGSVSEGTYVQYMKTWENVGQSLTILIHLVLGISQFRYLINVISFLIKTWKNQTAISFVFFTFITLPKNCKGIFFPTNHIFISSKSAYKQTGPFHELYRGT